MASSNDPTNATAPLTKGTQMRLIHAGPVPVLAPGVVLGNIDPESLDENIRNITQQERRCASAACVWPQRHEIFSDAVFKFCGSLAPRLYELHNFRKAKQGETPRLERSRHVAKFFTDLCGQLPEDANPRLRDAINYRQVY